MQSEQEGFENNIKPEIVQFHYRPSFKPTFYTQNRNNSLPSQEIINLKSAQFTHLPDRAQKLNEIRFKAKLNESQIREKAKNQSSNLVFEADFESGNLASIVKVSHHEYHLFMRPDSNTKTHFQWFYFKVRIRVPTKKVKFVIKNFIKPNMLYSQGLKPFCKSSKNQLFSNFKQIQTPILFQEETSFCTLTFSYHFEHFSEQVEFCSQPPYTFTHLQTYLSSISTPKSIIGKTFMGNQIPFLTFKSKLQTKSIMIVMARQHPGEAVGSWMMEGFINHIVSNPHPHITTIVIPMVNVDGVMVGNNRTGVQGHDFNRNWFGQDGIKTRSQRLFPQISGVVEQIKKLKEKNGKKIKLFLDLHGHSSQSNVFTYGPPYCQMSPNYYLSRLFPLIMSQKNEFFSLNKCSYNLKDDKKRTARWIFFNNFKIPFTYTVESTFGIMNGKQVSTSDFINVGSDIAFAAFQFLQTLQKNDIELNQIISTIKMKYIETQEGEEYDSGSEESEEEELSTEIQHIFKGKKKEKWRYSKNEETRKKMREILRKERKVESKKRMNTDISVVQKVFLPKIKNTHTARLLEPSMGNFIKQDLKILNTGERAYKIKKAHIGNKILVISSHQF